MDSWNLFIAAASRSCSEKSSAKSFTVSPSTCEVASATARPRATWIRPSFSSEDDVARTFFTRVIAPLVRSVAVNCARSKVDLLSHSPVSLLVAVPSIAKPSN